MRLIDDTLLFSATDLVEYLACEHLARQELLVARGALNRVEAPDPALEVISRRGLEHEHRYLAHLRSLFASIAEIPPPGADPDALSAACATTVEAMRNGAEVIYQAAFLDGQWRGYADFLLRVDTPSELSAYSYEVVDAKLARSAKASALLQMCAYSELLARVQGMEPRRMHLALGDMTVKAYRVRDFSAYYRAVKRRFEAAVLGPSRTTYPEPVEHCAICSWQAVCQQRRRADDHLSLVATMRRDQALRLVAAGITTVADLASSPSELRVPRLSPSSFARLRQQAALQVRQRQSNVVEYELLPEREAGRGLCALPPPSPGDVFFDMEGDPFVTDDGLEYLFGVVELIDGAPRFHSFWAHDRAEEKAAFERFIDFVMGRLASDPNMHVYHYAAYETTALKRLMGLHATRETQVDQLLRGGVLVDLYEVVRQGLRVSKESYSIKKLEPLYMESRDEAIKDAATSIVAYERWIDGRNPADLKEIADYNEADCLSTWKLRDWLEQRRTELAQRLGEDLPRPERRDAGISEKQIDVQTRITELIRALTNGVPTNRGERDEAQQGCWLLAQLLDWHRREEKPEWWAYFDRMASSDDELLEDGDAIGQLEYEGVVGEVARSQIHRYQFDPTQDHKILAGSNPLDPRTERSAGTVEHIDSGRGVLDLKRVKGSTAPHPRSLVPGQPIGTAVLRESIGRFARWVVEHDTETPGPYQPGIDLLLRRPPRIAGLTSGQPLMRAGASAPDAARSLVMSLERGCLPIQGPPGSGKTFTGAQMILDLFKAGRRVGISSNSHRAISNLLDAVCSAASAEGLALRALQRANDGDRGSSAMVRTAKKPEDVDVAIASGMVDVLAGTPWLFAREQLHQTLDVLFVDEAGQMSLANTLAIAGAARNLVLLGDPQQLPQPSQGAHPPGAEQSALGHVLGDGTTIPPEQGLLLDTTWRLHPDICGFISELAYDDRLHAHASCSNQRLAGGSVLGGTGLRYVPVRHAGSRSSSDEEVAVVGQILDAIVGRAWTDSQGQTRPLTVEDVLVVAPYNAQVARLAARLPSGARVGTVDKFQGQEAPVVIFSTATSTAEDLPRAMDFLFSLNRLNVAISRARGLAVLVSSPSLLWVRCRTPEQMRLVNAFHRFIERATVVDVQLPAPR